MRELAMKLYTIGFTKHTAEEFFEKLKSAGVKQVIDIRINKTSQLAAFAKGSDLPYLLKKTSGIGYLSHSELAPTKELLKSYRSKVITWEEFETLYKKQIEDSKALLGLNKSDFDGACLLCSEETAEKCHRRLLAEELAKLWDVEIIHL
jgi:uncharacterized protein (DUF488 family)